MGFIYRLLYFNRITPEIRALKANTFGHELVVLHEHDIRKRNGPFKALNKEARALFMAELAGVMEQSEMTIIAVVIDKPKHKARYADPYHPYHLALQFGLERLGDFLKIQDQEEKVTHIICEARGAKEDNELELEFRRVCDGMNKGRRKLPFEIVIAHKQTNSEGLQLADLVARPIGLSVLRPKQPNRAYEIIERKLFTGRSNCIAGNGLKVFP
ncbi:DUF3800 domain-containing protein [Motiliproteus sp. MSK22-1]|uniref:DUF3800 domain-containing protein n=1 Tax=Motiliproteus sp. MSK22-1 TaxID=1897630 RepID=UPI0009770C20|nr:DUF3800 domain-containing protein [Motiliproteus sp. MSK22-1]OMH30524.1 hypothetical protein BGP75_17440 [Motiliproteus sp. MSK22-1]